MREIKRATRVHGGRKRPIKNMTEEINEVMSEWGDIFANVRKKHEELTQTRKGPGRRDDNDC